MAVQKVWDGSQWIIISDTNDYNEYSSSYDSNGIATQLDIKRSDGTLYQRFVLSNPNSYGQYLQCLKTEYDASGVIINNKTKTFTFTYNSLDTNPLASPATKVVS